LIFIFLFLDEKIKATGRPAEKVILDLLRDRFQEHAQPNAQAAPECTQIA